MSVIAPTLVFRTFPATTVGVDGGPPEPPVTIETITREIIGQLPVMFGNGEGEDGMMGIGIKGDTGATGPAGSGSGSGQAFPTIFDIDHLEAE